MRDFLFIKVNTYCIKVHFRDLQYIESVDKYFRLVTAKEKYMALGQLYHIEKRLPKDQFCRIHRSYIISFQHIIQFNSEVVRIANKELPIGRYYRPNFYQEADILYPDESPNHVTQARKNAGKPSNGVSLSK